MRSLVIVADGGAAVAADAALLSRMRSLLVIGDDPELAVALRSELDRSLVTVHEVHRSEAAAALAGCRPWPWAVAGDVAPLDDAVLRWLGRLPSALFWTAPPPAGLAGRVEQLSGFAELLGAVRGALAATVGGLRLAVGDGLTDANGRHLVSPALEALLTSHPRPVPLTTLQVRATVALLQARGIPLRVRVTARGAVLSPGGGH